MAKFKIDDIISNGNGINSIVLDIDSNSLMYKLEAIQNNMIWNETVIYIDTNYTLVGTKQSMNTTAHKFNKGDYIVHHGGRTLENLVVDIDAVNNDYILEVVITSKVWRQRIDFTDKNYKLTYVNVPKSPPPRIGPSASHDPRICRQCQVKGELTETPSGYEYQCRKHGSLGC
jgi:hypothetical protein